MSSREQKTVYKLHGRQAHVDVATTTIKINCSKRASHVRYAHLAKFESKNVVTIILVTEHVYSLERTTHSAFPANDVKPARRATLTTLHTAAKTAEPARRNFHRWLHAHTSVTRSVPGHVMYLLPTAATLERVQTVPWNMVPPAILHAALDICWTLLIKTNRNVGPTAGSSLEAQ